jgi:hypothetical protein
MMKTKSKAGKERGELWDFVRRHPFISRNVLDELHGPDIVENMIVESEKWLKTFDVKGVGACFADRKEPNASLMDLGRAEVARRYALRVMGKQALLASVIPGFEADGELMWNDRWWRLWVDPGGCAPEALRFIQTPPKDFGDEVQDLIITEDASRMDSLARQVEFTWGGGKKVYVMHAAGKLYRIARPRSMVTQRKKWTPYGAEELTEHIRQRQRRSHKLSLLASVAKNLDAVDWGLLVEVGNIPLMTRYEMAYLQTDAARGMREMIERLTALEEAGLVETALSPIPRDQLENRKVLSTLGLETLAAYWGTSISNLIKMHPWPQVVNGKSRRPEYGLRWLEMFGEHHRMVRRFCLALVYGSRCAANNLGEAHVNVVTTIGSRLLYRDQRRRFQKKQTGVVKPDGLIWIKVEQRGWMDGLASAPKPIQENTVWLEADRGTMGPKRLGEKLDGYADVWESLQHMKPVILWVIDSHPAREVQILEMMKERGIDGRTVLMERLVLPEKDSWWLFNVPVARDLGRSKVGLKYDAFGGMAPWREIWKTTKSWDQEPLLGVQPWKDRQRRRSPPRKGEQEWIRYRNG